MSNSDFYTKRLLHWTAEIRQGNYRLLSKVIRYGDPLYIFKETVTERLRRNDFHFVGPLTIEYLRNTRIWQCIETFRVLSVHATMFATTHEINMAACNLYNILRMFGVTLEEKEAFCRILEEAPFGFVFLEEGYLELEMESPRRLPAEVLREEYEAHRIGITEHNKYMRILYRALGNIVFKCVAQRDGLFRRNCDALFKSFDMGNLDDTLPPLVEFPHEPAY